MVSWMRLLPHILPDVCVRDFYWIHLYEKHTHIVIWIYRQRVQQPTATNKKIVSKSDFTQCLSIFLMCIRGKRNSALVIYIQFTSITTNLFVDMLSGTKQNSNNNNNKNTHQKVPRSKHAEFIGRNGFFSCFGFQFDALQFRWFYY